MKVSKIAMMLPVKVGICEMNSRIEYVSRETLMIEHCLREVTKIDVAFEHGKYPTVLLELR